jgi:hypothetical protein
MSGRDYKLYNNGGTFGVVVELKGATGSYRFLVTKKGGSPAPHDVSIPEFLSRSLAYRTPP